MTGDQGKHIESDAQALGVAAPKIENDPAPTVWTTQITAWHVFVACATQWRIVAGQAAVVHQGIDYGALEAVMRMHGVEDMTAVFGQVQAIEAGALEVINA